MLTDLLVALAALLAGAAAVRSLIRWSGRTHRRARTDVDVIAVLAAIGSVFADASPTGHEVVDIALRAGFVAVVTVATARARREAVLVAAAVAAVASTGDAVGAPLSFGALGAALASTTTRRRSRLVGGVTGALLSNALLHLAWPSTPRGTALVAAVAAAIVVGSALRRLRSRERRRVLAWSAGAVVATSVAAGVAGVAVLDQRDEVAAARQELEAGVAAARRGETVAARRHLDAATASLTSVVDRLDSWSVQPARAIPVLAQNLDATRRSVLAVQQTGTTLAQATTALDLDGVRSEGGTVDVAALRLAEPLVARAAASAADVQRAVAESASPWLLPWLDDALEELRAEAVTAEADATAARDALAVLPGVLGADGPRQWLVLVANPAELRGGGGFVGNWAVLRADQGQLSLPIVERARTVQAEAPFTVSVSPEYDDVYVDRWGLERFFQNVTASPHLPDTAQAAVQIVAELGLGDFDGVMVVDPYAIAGMLELTGPIAVPWWPEPLSSANAARILLHEQYDQARDPERVDFLEEVTRTVFERVLTEALPSIGRIADVLGPLARQGRIQLHAFDPEVDAWIRRIGASSDLVVAPVDGIAVVDHDRVASKLDWFLRRRIEYRIDVDAATGEASAEATVTVTNVADDLPDNGYFGRAAPEGPGIGTMLRSEAFYAVLPLVGLELDGRPQGGVTFTERGYDVVESSFTVAPGASRVLRYQLAGELPIFGGQYRLDVHRQPTVVPDQLRVVVNGEVAFDGEHDRDLVLDVDLRAP